MAASVSSLGPPNIGPGNNANTTGFCVMASTKPGVYSNREPIAGNTLCHKNNVERRYAIHENRLASVKASLSLTAPLRLDFMDKRLSKNYHKRRHQAQVVYENLKLLRALEDIHSRSTGDSTSLRDISKQGRSSRADGGATVTLSSRKMSSGKGVGPGNKSHTIKLNTLLARKRDLKAALVARENQKMMERMIQSKSVYSLEKMRKHRRKHERILRLRKTDYTAGHLFAATKAARHWGGGAPGDGGFSNSSEDHGHRPSVLSTNASLASRPWSSAPLHTTTPCNYYGRKSHFVPDDDRALTAGNPSALRGPSVPRVSTRLFNVGDIYGGGNHLDSPDLQTLPWAEVMGPLGAHNGNDRDRNDRQRLVGDKEPTNRNTNHTNRNTKERASTRGKTKANRLEVTRGWNDGGDVGETTFETNFKGGPEGGKSLLRPSAKIPSTSNNSKDGERSTAATRGTIQTLDFLQGSNWSGSSSEGEGNSQCIGYPGDRGRFRRRFRRGGAVGAGDGTGCVAGGVYSGSAEDLENSDRDRIFNPLAFPDEKEGVRVLIQATKPLEVLAHPGETWMCFIRITAKVPFNDQFDVSVIHDREEVCRRVVTLQEAHKFCDAAEKLNQQTEKRDAVAASTNGPFAALPAPRIARASYASTRLVDLKKAEKARGLERAGRRLSTSIVRPAATNDERELNEVLRGLFAEADTDKKGYLTPEQLSAIMAHAKLGLTGPELQLVIAEADDNVDGNIDYYEFIPMAYNLVRAFRARRRACADLHDERLDLDQKAIHGIYDADFDRMVRQLKELCRSFDPKGEGIISRAEFKQCISPDRCGGLTNIESKLLLNLMPKDTAGNVIYRKLGAGMEQVRFTTLRNTVAEAAATDTQKYLMELCREEDAKSDSSGSKQPHLKNAAAVRDSSMAGGMIGGKHYSGFLRARQLTNLLLNAPLLSLSRLHVTAVMSQAHLVDGMVNYVDLVPMMAKTIEGIFHPRSLKIRHNILKMQRGSATAVGEGSGAVAGGGTTVRGKSRDDIQKLFMDVLRDGKDGNDIDRLQNPETFANCMESLDLGLEADTINALWEAADLGNREGTTFVDVVDFCFNCVLFLEREKEVKTLQRTINDSGSIAQSSSLAAAAAETAGEPPAEKLDPMLNLARELVRHAKVVSREDFQVGLEFLDDSQIVRDPSHRSGESKDGHFLCRKSAGEATNSLRMSNDNTDDSDDYGVDEDHIDAEDEFEAENYCAVSGGGEALGVARPWGSPEIMILVRVRRRVPVVGSAGQRLISRSTPAAATVEGVKNEHSSSDAEGVSYETREMIIHVYWEGMERDRAYVEASYAEKQNKGKMGRRGRGRGGGKHGNMDNSKQERCRRLSVRVPTLAVVDAKAARKLAERLAQQVLIEVVDGEVAGGSRQSAPTLRLAGVIARASIVEKST